MDGEERTDGIDALCDGGEEEPDSGEKRCVNCGAPLSRYSKFCSECGTEQSGDADTGQDEREWQQDEQDGRGGEPGTGRQPGGGEQSGGGQFGPRREPGGGQQRTRGQQSGSTGRQQRTRGQQSGSARRQQRGSQQSRRQPDRLQTAGPDSSTGLAAVTHILALFTGLIGPILLYAIADDPFVRENAANATNWQIMLIVYSFATFVLIFVFAIIFELFAFLAILVFLLLIPLNFVFILIGAIKATNGDAWGYPITPDLL